MGEDHSNEPSAPKMLIQASFITQKHCHIDSYNYQMSGTLGPLARTHRHQSVETVYLKDPESN